MVSAFVDKVGFVEGVVGVGLIVGTSVGLCVGTVVCSLDGTVVVGSLVGASVSAGLPGLLVLGVTVSLDGRIVGNLLGLVDG